MYSILMYSILLYSILMYQILMYQYLMKLIHYRDFIDASDESIYLMSKRFKSDIISDTALLLYIISTE